MVSVVDRGCDWGNGREEGEEDELKIVRFGTNLHRPSPRHLHRQRPSSSAASWMPFGVLSWDDIFMRLRIGGRSKQIKSSRGVSVADQGRCRERKRGREKVGENKRGAEIYTRVEISEPTVLKVK
jgi:hypothetical protein